MASDLDLSATFIPSLYKPAALLPIARHRQSLLYLIETYPVTIVVGQTGSGKTTQLPQFLDQAGWCSDGKIIAVTQVGFVLVYFYSSINMFLFLLDARLAKVCHSSLGGWLRPQSQRG